MKKTSDNPSASRASIIQAVQHPLGFFTLGLLILETALLVINSQASEGRTGLLWASLILIFLTLLLVGLLSYLRPDIFGTTSRQTLPVNADMPNQNSKLKYKVFITSPMASFQDNEKYTSDRLGVINIVSALKKFCSADNVYYPGIEIPSIPHFDDNLVATRQELEALQNSELFMLIYPERVPSSSLFLTGYAIATGKISIIFSKRKTLPFLMQELDHLPPKFSDIRIYEFDRHDDIVKIVQNNGPDFLR